MGHGIGELLAERKGTCQGHQPVLEQTAVAAPDVKS
jgi:hypothetical protein